MLAEWLRTSTLRTLALYLRRTGWDKGRWRLSEYAVQRAIQIAPRLGRRVVRTRHGFRMDLNLRDFICQVVWATGEFEQHTTHLLLALLQPGDTVIDVGANVGYFTLLAGRAVGTSGKVHAFEPVPATRADLDRNVELNRLAQVIVHEEALSDATGEATIYLGPESKTGIAALRPFDEQAGRLTIRTARFDELVPDAHPVRIVKIDVEGAELRVLEGMRECLGRHHPDLIVEICDEYLREMNTSAEAVCELLDGHGYRMYGMDYDGLVPMNGCSTAAPPLFNAFFTRRDRLPAHIIVKSAWHSPPSV